jgi:hypothetical protein
LKWFKASSVGRKPEHLEHRLRAKIWTLESNNWLFLLQQDLWIESTRTGEVAEYCSSSGTVPLKPVVLMIKGFLTISSLEIGKVPDLAHRTVKIATVSVIAYVYVITLLK